MYNIAIRADGGPVVGLGHIIRCLAVAEELKRLGCRVYFISRYRQGIDKVKALGFEPFEIDVKGIDGTGYNYGSAEDLEDDINGTRLIIEQQGCDLLLVDKYNLTKEYFDRLREIIKKVAFIDDLNMFRCSADVIINGNINATLLGYKECFRGQLLLLGTELTLLRREFSNIPKREINRLENEYILAKLQQNPKIEAESQLPEIMITTGGADPYNCTGKLLEILLVDKRTANIRYNVIVSSGFVHKDKIQRLADENSNIVLYINPKRMSEIMCRSDLAISSGGSTLYELCCCGTPTIAFIMADNQKGIVDMLTNDGYIQSLGWYNNIENTNLIQIVYDLINNFEERKKYSQKMQCLIDGRGALRIAQEIVTVVKMEK